MAHPICYSCNGPLVLREIARDDKGWTVAWVCVKCEKAED